MCAVYRAKEGPKGAAIISPEAALPSQRAKSRPTPSSPRAGLQFPLLQRVTVDCNQLSRLMRRDDFDELRECCKGWMDAQNAGEGKETALPNVGKVRCAIPNMSNPIERCGPASAKHRRCTFRSSIAAAAITESSKPLVEHLISMRRQTQPPSSGLGRAQSGWDEEAFPRTLTPEQHRHLKNH